MNPRMLIFIALFTVTIGGIGVDLYSPSLPWIAQSMKVHQSLVKYTITTFLIGFAVGQLAFGALSDVHGRKWILSGGVFIFVISSLIAAFAKNIYMLMVMRCIQGFAAASCSVISKAMLTDFFTGVSLNKVLTSLGVAWALGPIVAPMIGGYLQHHYGWRANFYFYAAYSFVLLFMVFFFLKETLENKIEAKVSTIKGHYGNLLIHRGFMSLVIAAGLVYSLVIAFNIMGPFLIQRTLHYGPIVFGHMALIIGLAFFVGTSISRTLLKWLTPPDIIKIGLVMLLIFSIVYIFESYYLLTSLWTLVLPTFLMMLSAGLILPNCMVTCMRFFPQIAGITGSLFGCIVYLTTTITSSLFSLIALPNQRPYAWTLLCVSTIIAVILLLGFFPSVRLTQNE